MSGEQQPSTSQRAAQSGIGLRTTILVVHAIALTACGPDWTGTFEGTLSSTGVDTRYPYYREVDKSWSFEQSGDRLSFMEVYFFNCYPLVATVSGDQATINQVCTMGSKPAIGYRSYANSGTLKLAGDTITVDASVIETEYSYGEAGSPSTYKIAGTLTRTR